MNQRKQQQPDIGQARANAPLTAPTPVCRGEDKSPTSDCIAASHKFQALLRSRRFWTSIAATAVTGVLYSLGEIDGSQFADAITLIAGIYIGSVALEDGLRNLITLWLQQPGSER